MPIVSSITKYLGWKFLAGAATGVAATYLARPALVTAVKGGLYLEHQAVSVYTEAKTEFGKILAEAQQPKGGGVSMAEVLSELRQLRNEIAVLKAGLPSKPAA